MILTFTRSRDGMWGEYRIPDGWSIRKVGDRAQREDYVWAFERGWSPVKSSEIGRICSRVFIVASPPP